MDEFWKILVPTVAGGLISTAVALFAVRYEHRLQRKVQADDRVEAATTALMISLAEFNGARAAMAQWGRFGAVKGTDHPAIADGDSVSIVAELLIIATRGEDRKVARRISKAWSNIKGSTGDIKNGIGLLAGAISGWRVGDLTETALEFDISTAEKVASGTLAIEAVAGL